MKENEKRVVRKSYKNLPPSEVIRLGNNFVDDFLFEDNKAVDMPIDALRAIFNIAADLRNEQLRPQDRPQQLSLFEDEFETEHNTFASMKIKNSAISPSGTSKQVINAVEYLTKFKMGWYKSVNSKGKEIKTFGGLITAPSYDERGYTTFLISSYWLKKLIVIPEYNPTLYNLVYNIRNNKHIIFAIWLAKVPYEGTTLKLSTFNEKFNINYATAKDFCNKFLKPIRVNLDKFNQTSFNFSIDGEKIHIKPYATKRIQDDNLSQNTQDATLVRQRIRYFQRRHELNDKEMVNLKYHYKSNTNSRNLIETSYNFFVKDNRKQGVKSTDFKGNVFLRKLQECIIIAYRDTKTGKVLPDGYISIV